MSAQLSLSTLETSPPFPIVSSSCDSSHSSSSSALVALPSLYVTFKVLQLVNTFRKCVKTRVQSTRHQRKDTSTRVVQDFCQDFERRAFEEIDRYLGRKTTAHSRKTAYPKSNRYQTSRFEHTGSERAFVATATKEEEPSISSRSIEWLLRQLDQSVKSEELSLSTVAASDRHFVKRKTDFHIERLPLKELTQLLLVIKDLLSTLRRTSPSRSGVKTLSEGNELLDLSLDESINANLEHLLLCLRDQLLRLLIAGLVELVHKHVVECQRDQSKHTEQWFFEFPDARHPLSTTWPWSIRPSLAVIWGVCWMFYDSNSTLTLDNEGNMIDEQGQVIATRQQVESFLLERRQQEALYQGPANYFSQAYNQPAPSHRTPADPHLPRSMPSAHSPRTMAQPHGGLAATTSLSQIPNYSSSTPDPSAHASAGLTVHGTNNNTYSAAPRAYETPAPADSNNWLPEADFAHHLSGFQNNAYATDVGQAGWAQLTPHSVPEQQPAFGFQGTLPPGQRPRNPSTPTIRVTTDFSGFPDFHQQPQDHHHSASSLTSNSSQPLIESYTYNPYNSAHLSPQASRPFMHSDQREMQTPPHSPLSPQAISGPQLSRKRSHSEMSGNAQVHPHSAGGSRSGSVTSLQPEHSGDGEEHSPRNRSIKRGDPPTNAEGKYICTFAIECSDQTFDRKCEWSKHMDKHDRPYRCQHSSCAKLQGFTYSGGLLRHEREVHGKHGGPKSQLICPYEDCKRHAGKGFTRKENLNEHIRRVHQNKDTQSQVTPLKREATDALPGAEEAETPASRISEIEHEDPRSPAHKRRRYNTGFSERSASEDVEDIKHELHRLRAETTAKDNRIAQLEANQQQMAETIRQMQQQQSQTQG